MAEGERSIYQLKVTLRGIRPPIWRRLQVWGDTSLEALHLAIQHAMGWGNCHLYCFEIDGEEYFDPLSVEELGGEYASQYLIDELVRAPKSRFKYMYDFGDGWEHDVLVEKILAPEPGAHYPRCLAGRRACPLEDIGGVWGYAGFLEAMNDPEHPERAELMEWAGGSIDPEEFNLDNVNSILRRLDA